MVNVSVAGIPKVNISLLSNQQVGIVPEGNQVVINEGLNPYDLLICDGGDASGYLYSDNPLKKEGAYAE